MRYYLDCEFIENGKTIDLISIGIHAEDGRTYYAQNINCDFSKASDWVWRNVFPLLKHFDMSGRRSCQPYDRRSMTGSKDHPCVDQECPWRSIYDIRDEVREFINPEKHGKPEFWGYYADYDWVAICQLFGTMIQLPKGWPMYCRDVKQLCDDIGNPRLPQYPPGLTEHHALHDATWTMEAHQFLQAMQTPKSEISNLTPPLGSGLGCYRCAACDWFADRIPVGSESYIHTSEAKACKSPDIIRVDK